VSLKRVKRIYVTCDSYSCEQEEYVGYSDLDYWVELEACLRARGWQIGNVQQFCPNHRTRPKRTP